MNGNNTQEMNHEYPTRSFIENLLVTDPDALCRLQIVSVLNGEELSNYFNFGMSNGN
jgi:hypothetical protein